MTSSLMERMLKTGATNNNTNTLDKSVIFDDSEMVPTPVPALNIILGGSPKAGIASGISILAAPSKHFKSSLGLLAVSSYMAAHKDAICLFYDSEFGAPKNFFASFGVDPSRVIHIPVDNLETFKFDIMRKLEEIKRGDKVIIFVDSIGNTASKKEVEDAESEKSSADMTRAKVLKSIFRMITPTLALKSIPLIGVNHVYQEIGAMYPKTIMGGGTGPLYSAQNVIFVSRAQEKGSDGDIDGYNFTLVAEKSRLVRERSKIALEVRYDGGINRWSGLLDLALEYGLVTKPNQGWYTRPFIEGDKKWRAKDTNCAEFWVPIFRDTNFIDCIEENFKIPENAAKGLIEEDNINDILG